MKRFVIILFLLFIPLAGLSAKGLGREWRQYNRLSKRDRPRDQIEKLHKIRTLALDRRLPDDLIKACREEVRVYDRLNWKSTDSLERALTEVIESYGVRLLTYRWLNDDWEYAKEHREELSSGRHPDIQPYRITFLQTWKEDDIADDFEWILWQRLTRNRNIAADSEEFRFLEDKIGDRYPARPYLLYLKANHSEDRLSAMRSLAEQYSDDPFRFIPERDVLMERLNRIQKEKNPVEADAKALYEDAKAFSKAVKAEKGVHQRMDLSVDRILDVLGGTSLSIAFKNDSIILAGRNFGRGTLTFRSDENRKTVPFRNRKGPFYVKDTVRVPVPALPDGCYFVYSEGCYETSAIYRKLTLSMAVRRQGDGFAVYVTDYLTGEPVPSVTIRLSRKKKVLEREISLDGFTLLPADFQKMIGKKNCFLEARAGDRQSDAIYVGWSDKTDHVLSDKFHGRVFKDRGAYLPGDTLKAKAVLYTGDLTNSVNTVKAGESVRIHISNAEGKTMTDIDLKTNSFGSVSWEWPIPVGERNGLFGIDVIYKKATVSHSVFRVDDFVLPSFDITFDPQETPYIPGTDFEIGGKLTSYSGHPVDGIAVDGIVTPYYVPRQEEWKGQVTVDASGAFLIPLNLNIPGKHRLELHAVDATGETRRFEHVFEVTSSLSLQVELDNSAGGDFSYGSKKLQNTVLTETVGRFAWTVKSGDQEVRLPVNYNLVNFEGNTVLEGISEDETLELDLSSCPDGLYFLHGFVSAGSVQKRISVPVLKITSGLDAPVRSLFLSGETEIEYGEPLRARLGAGNGPLWAVATLYAPDGEVLESRPVHLDGVRSLTDLTFQYKDTYPGSVRLEVFYFRDAEKVTHQAVYHRVRHSMDLPLSFSRFEDLTRPGAPCTLSLQTEPGVEVAVAVFDKSLDAINPNTWKAVELRTPVFMPFDFQASSGVVTGGRRRHLTSKGMGLVDGIVTDPGGEPITGAVVSVIGAGASLLTTTDSEGYFSLDVPAWTPLEIVCIGYERVEVPGYPGMDVVLEEDDEYLDEVVVVAYGVSRRENFFGSVNGIRIRGIGSLSGTGKTADNAHVYEKEDVEMPDIPDEAYREVFSEALAFEPFLYSDRSGKIDVSFHASDKLSSYHVNVFAHDPTMRNAVLQRDFVVTVPVRISVTRPRLLYEGDRYVLSASVSNISNDTLGGRLYLNVETDDAVEGCGPVCSQAVDLTVPADGSASAQFTLSAPSSSCFRGDNPHLEFRLVFEGDGFSDAMRFSIPVNRAEQLLTECHSALAGPESVDSLRRMFVNVPGENAEVSVRTLREIVETGLEQWTAPDNNDALSLSADFYARALLGRDTTGTLSPILALRCEDGGFAWMEGMDSSPVVTATLLERFARLRDKGFAIPDMEAAVHYLDRSQFGNWFPMWCGGLSDEQYMDIRAMWASVPFDLSGVEEKDVRRFRLKDFRRFARAYLTPGRYDYANGWVLDKARRVRTLMNLTSSESGIALGKAWGERVFTASRFEKTISNDLISLEQYAVRHPSGGLYYPNAVLPFRGLLSSEVYAHTLLAGLMDGPVSDGIKLWLIVQNETQSWTGDPAYVDALQTVLDAPDSLLGKQVVTLMSSAAVPFKDIRSSGNGMRIDRKFYKEDNGTRTEIMPGDTLAVGDRIIASYELWSEENRSFVRVDAFREACLLPCEQRSGPVGIAFDPIRIDGVWTRMAQCYRDVRIDRTSWWIDVCPEENSTWEESFYVTQAGIFTAPVITVESQYAPQYRANAAYCVPLVASRK